MLGAVVSIKLCTCKCIGIPNCFSWTSTSNPDPNFRAVGILLAYIIIKHKSSCWPFESKYQEKAVNRKYNILIEHSV